MLAVAPSASADTVYTYTGSPFTSFVGGYACPPVCRVTGSFTLPLALPANFGFAQIVPSSYAFTDGLNSWNNTNSTSTPLLGSFAIATNSLGLIAIWDIRLVTGFNHGTILSIENTQAFIGDESNFCSGGVGCVPTDFAKTPLSGSWSAPAPVPEPTTLLLLVTGLLGLGTKVLRRKQIA